MAAQSRIQKAIVLALGLIGLGLMLSGLIALQFHLANGRQLQRHLQADAQKEVHKVEERLASYRQALFNARSFVLAHNGHPSPQAFAQYVAFINLAAEFPGMRGIGVIDRVKAADEKAYIERMRREGLDTFNLRFIKPHDGDRYVIRLIEPIINNRQARGLDTASEALRRDAAERAYARNAPQLTGPITLMQAQDKVTQAFLFFLPVFADWQIPSDDTERARLHIGWVYEPLVMQEILRGAHFNDDLFHYLITDVTAENPQRIYACEDYVEIKAASVAVVQNEIFGRQWQFTITPTEKYLRRLDLTEPKLVLLSGTITTLLLAFVAAMLNINLSQRRHTQTQNARLAALVEGTADAIIEVNLTGEIVQWSRGAEQMFGVAGVDAAGKYLNQLIVPEAQRAQADSELHAAIEQRTKTDSIAQRCTQSGKLLDVLVYTAPLLGEQNKVIGAATIIRDISSLRAAERDLKELNAHLETRVALRTAQVVQARDELESLVNALPYAVLAVSVDGRIYKANQKSRERFASAQRNIMGLRLEELLPADYYAQITPWLFYLPEGQVNSAHYTCTGTQGLEHYQWILIPAISQNIYKGFYFVEQDVSILKNNKIKLAATLAEQEALLKSINAQFLLSITDQNGIILSVNEPFCQFSGYGREELIGQSHSIMQSGQHGPEFWAQLWRHILSGEPWRGEVCNRHKNGDLYWVDTVIAPMRGMDGRIERFVALRSDITARRDAEAARNRISQLLTSVLNAASEVSIIATDLNGVITVFNRGAERLLGFEAEEVVGQLTPAVFHLPDEIMARSAELSAHYAEPIAGFDTFVYLPRLLDAETRRWTYVRKDNTEIPVLLTVTTIRSADGAIEGYLGVAMDISAQLASQAQVAAVTEKLLQAAAVAHLGIWTWVFSSNELQWNEQMFELYQQDPALQLNGQLTYVHWAERLVAEDLAGAEAGLQAAIRGEAEYDLIFRLNLPSGALRYIKAQGRVSRDKHGTPVSITGINLDITDLYLHEEELRLARDSAQEANRAKSQFLANISHEIRTPMNAVLGMLQLLQTTSLSERQQEYSHNAIGAARSLLGLLNDVLDFSKIEAGKLQLDAHEFAVEQLLHDVAIVLTGIQGAKQQVELLFDIGRDVPRYLVADKLRLQQILINLTSNALKFTERGFVKLSINLLAQDTHQVSLEVRVEDTGIGIAPEHQQKIFDGFTQAEASTTRRFGGTGLGLVICQRLLALMHAELKLTSRPGHGSQFWFVMQLPVAAQPNSAATQSNSAIPPHYRQVLLMDDNAHARALVAEQLAAWADQVLAVDSVAAAVQLIQQQGMDLIDLVVVDWRLAPSDGLSALMALAEASQMPLPKVVFMVRADDKEALHLRCNQEHFAVAGIILKPIIAWHWPQLWADMANAVAPNQRALQVVNQQSVLHGLTFLVVEDNELNRQVAWGLLTHLGAKVDVANSGLEAVEKLIGQKAVYDLVFMDMQMPDMDGLQATRRLRQEPRLRALPIVAMTANVSPADVEACLAAGMNDHVGKPLDIEHIVAVIGRYVAQVSAPIASQTLTPAAPVHSEAITEPWPSILLRFGNNTKLISRVRDRFGAELSQQLTHLHSALAAQERSDQARVFHSIKGVAATVGAIKLAHWCAEQEKLIKGGRAADAEQLEQLRLLCDEATAAIAELFAQHLPSL